MASQPEHVSSAANNVDERAFWKEVLAERDRYKRALETIVKTTKLGGAADIARRALGSEFVK